MWTSFKINSASNKFCLGSLSPLLPKSNRKTTKTTKVKRHVLTFFDFLAELPSTNPSAHLCGPLGQVSKNLGKNSNTAWIFLFRKQNQQMTSMTSCIDTALAPKLQMATQLRRAKDRNLNAADMRPGGCWGCGGCFLMWFLHGWLGSSCPRFVRFVIQFCPLALNLLRKCWPSAARLVPLERKNLSRAASSPWSKGWKVRMSNDSNVQEDRLFQVWYLLQ